MVLPDAPAVDIKCPVLRLRSFTPPPPWFPMLPMPMQLPVTRLTRQPIFWMSIVVRVPDLTAAAFDADPERCRRVLPALYKRFLGSGFPGLVEGHISGGEQFGTPGCILDGTTALLPAPDRIGSGHSQPPLTPGRAPRWMLYLNGALFATDFPFGAATPFLGTARPDLLPLHFLRRSRQ